MHVYMYVYVYVYVYVSVCVDVYCIALNAALQLQIHDTLAEWSKALASGASPKGRGFEPHSRHFQKS